MGREHKYRAWDGEKMLGPISVEDMMFAPGFHFDHLPWSGPKDNRHTSAVILQYTGLLDKNGVEIYEGDIVRDCEFDVKGEVRWKSCGFSISTDVLILTKSNHLVVIGNVFENPELLNT